jgi:hypothetical protein
MKMQRFSAAVGAVALAVTMSGCGADHGSTHGVTGGNAAAALTPANFTKTVTSAQKAVKSAHMDATIKVGGQGGSISGDFAGSPDDLASMKMDMTLKVAGHNVEVRLVNKVVYVHAPGMPGQSGKPWLKLDLSDPSNPLASLLDSANPKSFTSYLQAVKGLKDRGVETVDGVSTRHYTITIATAKALAASPAFKSQDISKLGLPGTITGDVWLNSDNLPVKIVVRLGSLGSFEAHFSKYGEPVTVNAPPAKQVGGFSLPS